MATTEDRVLAHLFVKLRRLPADRVKAAADDATARAVPLVDVAAEQKLLPAPEAAAFAAATRFLIVGSYVRACAACKLQVYAPPVPPRRCGKCQGALARGILATPDLVAIDPELEKQLRRLVLDTLSRQVTQERVTAVRRLRDEGKVGKRAEAELPPKEQSVQESMLGPYKLLGLAGRGSSTYVYKAEDSRTGQGLALKVLYFSQGETPAEVAEKLARFKREASLASKLQHPHLLTVGPLEQTGAWYHFAMPFVDGPNLAQLLEARYAGNGEAGARPSGADLRAMLNALCDVSRGLHYAHCQGVIHRDVNPRNILYSMSGQAFLSDFGAAKPLDSSTRLTGAKMVVGSREYAAPERMISETRADARSDVYSLGLVLFEVLTGRLPFPRSEEELKKDRALFTGPPSARAFNPDVPPALEAVARKAMEKDPARRYGTALEFAEALADAAAEGDTMVGAPGEVDAAAPKDAAPGVLRRLAYAALAFALGMATMALTAPKSGPDVATLLANADRAHERMLGTKLASDYENERRAVERALEQAESRIGLNSPEVEYRQGRFAWSQGDLAAAVARNERGVGGRDGAAARAIGAAAAWLLAERHRGFAPEKAWLDKARALARGLPTEPPEAYETRFGAAMTRLLADDRDGAHAGFRDLARDVPARDEASVLYGRLALGLRNREQAAAALETASQAHPWQPLLVAAHGLALADAGKGKAGVEKARTAQTLWPEVVELPLAEAVALAAQSLTPQAALALGRAARVDPSTAEVFRRLAPLHDARQDGCRALAAHTRLLALDPKDGDARFHRGRLWLAHGDRARGETDLREYLANHAEGPFAGQAKELLGGK